ncbi:polymer-forming cytoskeletal protein [Streptomyces sp. NRRL S-118]|uniref:polymer-forming cytoskeletal protein n=1 Tax=Streptomyces sp. NRRL S-118 TaxID=1463881 RepID=UPI00131AE804|nr:polymer-forming cytoskeletal protein [Streptomyces sp. NRRL S-118]
METIYRTWAETVTAFERRGLPQETYSSLDEDEYILHPGHAVLAGSLWLDDHQYRRRNPWIKAGGRPEYDGIDGAVTGYVIDGDLHVEGNILNLDYGSPSLIVLGDLKVANLVLAGTSRLLVQGDIEAETFVGTSTDQHVGVLGDLRAALAIMWDEFLPEVGGRLRGRVLVPDHLDLDGHGLVVEDPAPHAGLSDLVVPEVLIADGDGAGDDLYLVETGLRYEHMIDRMVRGLPVVRGGRTVAPLEELPPRQ